MFHGDMVAVGRGKVALRALVAGTALATVPAILPAALTGGVDIARAGCSGASYPLPYTEYKGTDNADTITCSDVVAPIKAQGGDDTLNLSGGISQAKGESGNDTFNVAGGAMGDLDGGDDNDTFNLSGGTVAALQGGDGEDTINLNGGTALAIDGGGDDDLIYLNDGAFGVVLGGTGKDTINLTGSSANDVGAYIDGGDDNDTLNLAGTVGTVRGGKGNDVFNVSAGAVGLLYGESGEDTVNLTGGLVTAIDTGNDNDTINLTGGVFGGVSGGAGADKITLNGSGANVGGAIIDGGEGNDTIDLKGGLFGAVLGGDGEDKITLSGASGFDAGAYINAGDDSDSFTWSGGSLLLFQAGAGDDTALVTTSNFTDMPILDGGDGSSDALTFDGVSFSVVNLTLSNWETITVSDGVMTVDPLLLSYVALGLSEDDGKGLVIESDAGLAVDDRLQLTGDLTNAGYVDMQDGATGDEIEVSDDYNGGGDLWIDADFTDNAADTLDIGGDLGGATQVSVNDISGDVITGEIILVASVGGANSGSLSLASDVFAGAFEYDLETIDDDWYLTSSFSPAAPIYDAFGQSLLALNRNTSLQQRMGERLMSAPSGGSAFWTRVSGSQAEYAPDSASEAMFKQTVWDVETGFDGLLEQRDDGYVLAGFSVRYSDGRTEVSSPTGDGEIVSRGGVASLSLTAVQNDGGYADARIQAGFFDNTLSSDEWGTLASGVGAWTGGASVEIGRMFALSDEWTITPQTQVSGVVARMDGFTGVIDEDVSFANAVGVTWRTGVSVDWARPHAGGATSLQGIANLNFVLAGDSATTVSGYDISSTSAESLSAEIGLGGSHSWSNGRFALTGQVTASTGIGDAAEDHRFGGQIGFSARW